MECSEDSSKEAVIKRASQMACHQFQCLRRGSCCTRGISRWVRLNFFDLVNQYAGLDAHGDPLVAIDAAAPFEMFQLKLNSEQTNGWVRRSDPDHKSALGRKPLDKVCGRVHQAFWPHQLRGPAQKLGG